MSRCQIASRSAAIPVVSVGVLRRVSGRRNTENIVERLDDFLRFLHFATTYQESPGILAIDAVAGLHGKRAGLVVPFARVTFQQLANQRGRTPGASGCLSVS